jgi:hypothetical protein
MLSGLLVRETFAVLGELFDDFAESAIAGMVMSS